MKSACAHVALRLHPAHRRVLGGGCAHRYKKVTDILKSAPPAVETQEIAAYQWLESCTPDVHHIIQRFLTLENDQF